MSASLFDQLVQLTTLVANMQNNAQNRPLKILTFFLQTQILRRTQYANAFIIRPTGFKRRPNLHEDFSIRGTA